MDGWYEWKGKQDLKIGKLQSYRDVLAEARQKFVTSFESDKSTRTVGFGLTTCGTAASITAFIPGIGCGAICYLGGTILSAAGSFVTLYARNEYSTHVIKMESTLETTLHLMSKQGAEALIDEQDWPDYCKTEEHMAKKLWKKMWEMKDLPNLLRTGHSLVSQVYYVYNGATALCNNSPGYKIQDFALRSCRPIECGLDCIKKIFATRISLYNLEATSVLLSTAFYVFEVYSYLNFGILPEIIKKMDRLIKKIDKQIKKLKVCITDREGDFKNGTGAADPETDGVVHKSTPEPTLKPRNPISKMKKNTPNMADYCRIVKNILLFNLM